MAIFQPTTTHFALFSLSHTNSDDFVPSDHGLQEGDVVEFFAVARDTRHSPLKNKLEANRTDTAKQYLRIVAADPLVESPAADDENPNRRLPEEQRDTPADDASEQNKESGTQSESGTESGSEKESTEQPSGNENQADQSDSSKQPSDEESNESGSAGEGLQGQGQQSDNAEESDIDSGQSGAKRSEDSQGQQGSGGTERSDSSDPSSDQNSS